MKNLALCLALMPAPILASCPALPDQTADLDAVYDQLLAAPSEAEARALSGQLWRIWLQAPDRKAQDLLDAGMEQRNRFDYGASRTLLDELVAYCPDYAEGYNQRAFTSYLGRDYAAALADLDQALALNPRHLGALTGKGLTLLGLSREAEAYDILREALALNPWLRERGLIPGTDI